MTRVPSHHDHCADPEFHQLFEAPPHPCLVLRPDTGFTIIAVNDREQEATGTCRVAMIGRSLFDVFPGNPDDLSGSGASDLRISLNRVLADRVPLEQKLHNPAGAETTVVDGKEAERMLRNARLLYRHVSDLLDVAKPEAGGMRAEYARIDFARLVRSLAAQFAPLALERGIAYRIAVPPTLTIEADGESALLEMQDNGPGVPTDMREAVFECFRQVEGGANRHHGGTGLGLAIVMEFARLHGGAANVATADGGGAPFAVRLPHKAPDGTPMQEAAAGSLPRRRRLLRVRRRIGTHESAPNCRPPKRVSRGCSTCPHRPWHQRPRWRILQMNRACVALFGSTLVDIPTLAYFRRRAQPDAKAWRVNEQDWQRRWQSADAEPGQPREQAMVCADGIRKTVLSTRMRLGEEMILAVVDITVQKTAETELRRRNEALERFDRASVDREMEMIRVKAQVNELARETERKSPYDLSCLDGPGSGATP